MGIHVKALNSGAVKYIDMHLSTMAQNVRYGFFGDLDVAIVEVCQINEDGSLLYLQHLLVTLQHLLVQAKSYRRSKRIPTTFLGRYA